MARRVLSVDIETYSSEDLTQTGVYRYAEAPDFEILLFAYAYDEEDVEVIDLASGERLPDTVLNDLEDPQVLKTAFNANFERTCIGKFFKVSTDPLQWECTMVKSLMMGLPGSLAMVAKVLKLNNQKVDEGKALINYFSKPCKPTKANGQRTRNLPEHNPEKWESFIYYCRMDVEVEREIKDKLAPFNPSTEKERKIWAIDQEINDRGVAMDTMIMATAMECNDVMTERLMTEFKNLTGLDNPGSDAQLKKWINAKGLEVVSLTKDTTPELMNQTEDPDIIRALELRQELSKSSISKYVAMDRCLCGDDRIRGLLQYCGAGRTWRWAGRLVQVQNLPKNKMSDLDSLRSILRSGDYEGLEMCTESVSDALSQLIRTAFVASEDSRFIVADFSAIEARVIAWLAGEKWRLDVFKTHGKIYEASAAQMFKVPIESITKGSDLRQKGKVSELALGYQGGPNALIKMGALDRGIDESELPKLVKMWRNSNPAIVKLWSTLEDAAVSALNDEPARARGINFKKKSGILFVTLPSGRSLCYIGARLTSDGKIEYEGMNQTTKKWEKTPTYGGKITENVVQAIARDCLAEAMLRLDARGYNTVMHIHDEVVLDVPNGWGSLEEVNEIMAEPVSWARGLPLKADAYETYYYMKD